jgi:hypothetical protein
VELTASHLLQLYFELEEWSQTQMDVAIPVGGSVQMEIDLILEQTDLDLLLECVVLPRVKFWFCGSDG